jgi:hypothetical protein
MINHTNLISHLIDAVQSFEEKTDTVPKHIFDKILNIIAKVKHISMLITIIISF